MTVSLSVCIPAYNRAHLLPDLLNSIVEQTYTDYEIAICEDASPERGRIAEISQSYAARYPGRVHYFENEVNLGYDGNLRRLIDHARGDYVVFMGNDDLMAEGALQAIADAICGNPNVGVVLRSYASFENDPKNPKQLFRYFEDERLFRAGAQTIATFFRRSVFISGMVVRRASASACATPRFDGTLLYQQHLVGQILAHENGVYVPTILTYQRLGGIPDFGNSAAERGVFVPRDQTPASSVGFMRGMLRIAADLERTLSLPIYDPILHDLGNYAYPFLALQRTRGAIVFSRYALDLAKLGFWRVPRFHVYALALLLLGPRFCNFVIARTKRYLGRAPILGGVFAGERKIQS